MLDAIDEFIEEESKFGRFLEPGVVVALACIAWAAQDVAVMVALGSEGEKVGRAYFLSLILHGLQPAGLWFLFATVFYLSARLIGGYGRAMRLYHLSGWGFITFIPAGIAWAVGKYYAYLGQTVRELNIREEVDLSVKWNITQTLEREIAGDPMLVSMAVVACLFVLSSVYLWTLAIDYSMSLDRRQSAVVAAAPALVYVVYVLSRVV